MLVLYILCVTKFVTSSAAAFEVPMRAKSGYNVAPKK